MAAGLRLTDAVSTGLKRPAFDQKGEQLSVGEDKMICRGHSKSKQSEVLKVIAIAAMVMLTLGMEMASAQSRNLGNGFRDHGPFADVTVSRGTVCTVDGEGRNVVLVWLFDNRYAYALGVIDAQTGAIEEIPRPIERDCPFASILSSQGRYYTYMGGHFLEFDPLKREFTVVQEGPSRAAMSMTEDDDGRIWAANRAGGGAAFTIVLPTVRPPNQPIVEGME